MTDDQRTTVELLYRVSREVAAPLDLRAVLTRLLFAILHNVGGERATIVVLDESGNAVDSAIVYGKQVHHTGTLQLHKTVEHGLAGWVVRNKQGTLVPDTSRDERWIQGSDKFGDAASGKSAICVPLLAREKLVGVMTLVHSTTGALTQDHFSLVQAIADQAGVAVLNALLFERLQKAHQRYQELFEDSIDPILVTGWDGRISEANRQAANITGFSVEELRSMVLDDFHSPNIDRIGAGYSHIRQQEVRYEGELRRRDGHNIPVEVHARRVVFNEIETIQWLLRDITSRKELDALRDDLAATIYHDLRSPLANIVSSLEILSSMLAPEEAGIAQSVLGIARHSVDRIQRLIHALLDINRLEAGQPVGERKEISVDEIIEDAIEAVKPATDNREQRLLHLVPPGLPHIWVDADMIRRVLINLMENASKYTPSNSQISLGARPDGNLVRFWVQDNGPGIAPEDQPRIFEKYTRLKTKGVRGFGIGLAFCRLAVESNGGQIWVESEPGKGSRFIFTVPTAKKSN